MFSGVVASPAQLRILSEVLEEYCLVNGLVSDLEREDAASLILFAYASGAQTVEQLRAALAAMDGNAGGG